MFRLHRLTLSDFRQFRTLEVDFGPRLTVLIAPNGGGKTSLLDAVAIALGAFVGGFDDGDKLGFSATDIRRFRPLGGNTIRMELAPNGCAVGVEATIPSVGETPTDCTFHDKSQVWTRRLTSPKSKTTMVESKVATAAGTALQRCVRTALDAPVDLPLISYYGAGRLYRQMSLSSNKLANTSRMVGYTDCLKPASSYKLVIYWLEYWFTAHLDAIRREDLAAQTEFGGLIESVMRPVRIVMAQSGWTSVDYSIASKDLVATDKVRGELPVHLLSDGIRSMLAMVLDIAFRTTMLNPHLGERASAKTSGVVLVDEVDLHLHPSWQQVVVESLLEAFPSLQFILTTHSPQVLSDINRRDIRVLRLAEDDTGKATALPPDYQTEGVSSAEVLSRVMGVSPVPDNDHADQVSTYARLLAEGQLDTPTERALLEQLAEHFEESSLTMQNLRSTRAMYERRRRLAASYGS